MNEVGGVLRAILEGEGDLGWKSTAPTEAKPPSLVVEWEVSKTIDVIIMKVCAKETEDRNM